MYSVRVYLVFLSGKIVCKCDSDMLLILILGLVPSTLVALPNVYTSLQVVAVVSMK